MSLFSSKDLEIEKQEDREAQFMVEDTPESMLIFKSKKDIDSLISLVTQRCLIHYCSNGMFSAHEILFSLLQLTGPAKVYLTTWTMTETPARLLAEGLDSKKILELYCVLDVRMEKNPNVYQLIRFNSTKIRLSHCHAKVIIIENNDWNISIISSQNMTENPRIEAGVISTNHSIMKFHRDWILKVIETGNEFE